MTTTQIESRFAVLERELTEVKKQLAKQQFATPVRRNWIDQVWGMYEGDKAFKEAMRLGRKWRQEENRKSLPRKKRK